MRRRIADVASGMHTPSGENMWSYPAKDSFSEDMEKAATGLLDVPKEIPGDSTFEQAPHMLEETDQGVGGLDRTDPTASSAEDSEIEMKTLVSALAVELNKRGYVKYAQNLEDCEFEVDQMGEASDPLVTSRKIDRKDLHQVTFTTQTGLEEVPTNVGPIKKELTYLGYLGYSNLSDVSWDLKCVKAWEKLSDTAEEFLRKTLNAENNTTIKNGGNPQAVVSLLLSMLHSGNLEKVLYVMQYIRQLDDWAKGVGAPSFKAANIRERRLKKIADNHHDYPYSSAGREPPESPPEGYGWKPPVTKDKNESASKEEEEYYNEIYGINALQNASTTVRPNVNFKEQVGNVSNKSTQNTLTAWDKYIANSANRQAAEDFADAWQAKPPAGYNSSYDSFLIWYKEEQAKSPGQVVTIEQAMTKLYPATPVSPSEPVVPAEKSPEFSTKEKAATPVAAPTEAEYVDIAAELENALRELATKEVKFKGGPPFRPERKQVVRWVARNHGNYSEAVQHIMEGTKAEYWQKLIQDNNAAKAESKGQLLHAPFYSALYNKLRTDKKEHRQQTRRDERKERRLERRQSRSVK